MPQVKCSQLSLKQYAMLFLAGKGGVKNSPIPLADLLSAGNLKVSPTTAIFNFASSTDCMSRRLGLCAAAKAGVRCYAEKPEVNQCSRYVLPYRRSQERFWFKTTAQEFVSQFIMLNALKDKPFTALRFSESGDFHCQHDVWKAERIAQLLSRFGIKCYTYTSRKDLDFSKVKHLVITGSGFMKNGVKSIFKIIHNKKEIPSGYGLCKGDCRFCNRCLIRGRKTCVLAH